MNNWDEALQQNIESGRPVEDGLDARAYRQVFDSLKKNPEYTLPPNFASRVVQKIEAKKERSASRELVWLAVGIFFIVVSLGVTIYVTGFKPEVAFLSSFRPYIGFLAFGVAFIALLNWVDRRFITGKLQARG